MTTDTMNDKYDAVLIFPHVSSNVAVKVLPFGLLSIASSLRKAGWNVVIFDLNVCPEQVILSRLNHKPLFIGFSVFTGPMIRETLLFSQKIHALHPDVPLVWGGPHPTIMPELTIEHPLVDIVCVGEGERTVVRLINALSRGDDLETVPGILYKHDTRRMKTVPAERISPAMADKEISLGLGAIDLSPYIFMNRRKKTAIFITSRGCPYRCSFCWNLLFHNRKYIAWSADTLRKELDPLIRCGVEKVLLLDSFLGPVRRVKAIGEMFKANKLEWAIEDGLRVDYHADDTLFETLSATNCTHVAFGAESGSQRMLDYIHKDITVDQILKSAELCNRHAIGCRYQWMTGLPGETPEDYRKTLDLIDAITRVHPGASHVLELYLPYPGNDLFDRARESGWIPPASLARWGTFRWEGSYPYHREGTWFYKSIQYSNFFYRQFSLASLSAFSSNLRPLYKIAGMFLWIFAALRWKFRFFQFPIEYKIAEFFRKKIEKATE